MRFRLWATGSLVGLVVIGGAGTAFAAPDRPGMVTSPRDAPGASTVWSLRNALSAGPATTQFAYGPAQRPIVVVTGDWDGNGTRTPGVVRVTPGGWLWSLRNSTSAGPVSIPSFTYGDPTQDAPVVGDWNGDGRDTVGVLRTGNLTQPRQWLLRDTVGPGAANYRFTFDDTSADARIYQVVVGDWDGNGTDTPGYVVRPAGQPNLIWRLRDANSAGPYTRTFEYGSATLADVAVVGDWDGTGPTGIGVVRAEPDTHDDRWLLRQTPSAGAAQYNFRYGTKDPDSGPIVWS